MALKDCDFIDTQTSLRTDFGGNGDYYLQLWYKDDKGHNQFIGFRAAMSGGPIKSARLKLAFAELYRAMEEENLNEYPE